MRHWCWLAVEIVQRRVSVKVTRQNVHRRSIMAIAVNVQVMLKRMHAVIALVSARMAVMVNVLEDTSMANVPAVMDITAIIDYEKDFFACGMLGVNAGLRWKWAVQAN